jgi:hypothetical protein
MCILAISNSYWPQSLFRNELEITKMIFLLLLITSIILSANPDSSHTFWKRLNQAMSV